MGNEITIVMYEEMHQDKRSIDIIRGGGGGMSFLN